MNQYLTKDNLERFLLWLQENKPFATYEDTRFNSGLKIYPLSTSSSDDKTILNVGEYVSDSLKIKQGTYYYGEDSVDGVKFGEFHSIDSSVMGEAMVQFKTKPTSNSITREGGDDWKWILSDGGTTPVFKPDASYQIHLTTDHAGNTFAELNKYETINVEEVVESTGSVWIEITYAVSSNSFEALSKDWLKFDLANIVNKVLYAADGINYKAINISDLKTNNKLSNSDTNPKLLVEFTDGEDCNINLSYLLRNIDFDTFKIQMPAKRIKSMCGMFQSTSSKKLSFSLVDLTGISDPINGFFSSGASSEMFVNMFNGRRLKVDTNGDRLKLFGVVDGERRGIDTRKATTLAGMFCNGPLLNAHCNPDNNASTSKLSDVNDYLTGPVNILRGLRFDSCTNFSELFSGCNISSINFDFILKDFDADVWKTRTNAYLNKKIYCNFSNIFSYTNISDPTLGNISKFINAMSKFAVNGEARVHNHNLSYAFSNCNNLEYGDMFKFDELYKDESDLMVVNLSHMFESCTNLIEAPEIILKHSLNKNLLHIFMDEMFSFAGTNAEIITFNNIGDWVLDFEISSDGYAPAGYMQLSLQKMFFGCPLYKMSNINGSSLNFCGRGTSKLTYPGSLIMREMFNQTASPDRNTSYNIIFNLWTGEYVSSMPYDYNSYSNILDTNNRGLCYIHNPNMGSYTEPDAGGLMPNPGMGINPDTGLWQSESNLYHILREQYISDELSNRIYQF